MQVTLIGIDCATDPIKVGLARGIWSHRKTTLLEATSGNRKKSLAQTIAGWISGTPTLIAIDAPLGWPLHLGQALAQHLAGECLGVDANHLFRRETDRVVKRVLNRQPLDVGADRIARTAHAALELLDELRTITGQAIPLAWQTDIAGACAIEVYPAATLTAYNIQATNYKKNETENRRKIIAELRRYLELPEDTSRMQLDADVLDAGVCVLAAANFLEGSVVQPTDMVSAKKEGWIWFRAKADPRGQVTGDPYDCID